MCVSVCVCVCSQHVLLQGNARKPGPIGSDIIVMSSLFVHIVVCGEDSLFVPIVWGED